MAAGRSLGGPKRSDRDVYDPFVTRASRAAEVQAFCIAAGLSDGLLTLVHATRAPDVVMLPLSLAFACAAGWIAWALAGFRPRLARLLLLLGGGAFFWLIRLSYRPTDHPHLAAGTWVVATAALAVVPFALARLPSATLVVLSPLLVAAFHTGLPFSSRLTDFASQGAVAFGLSTLLFLAVRFGPRRDSALVFLGATAGLSALLIPVLVHRTVAHVSSNAPAALPASPRDPNVVLVVLDTLRRDRLGTYGYRVRNTSPSLDALARDAEVYENAFAPSSWTLPSVATMFSGEAPESHGVTVAGRSFSLARPLLAEILARRGYDTIGITTNQLTDSDYGFARGFRRFVELSRIARAARRTPTLVMEAIALIQRLQQEGALPRFLRDWNSKPRASAAADRALLELDARIPGHPVFLYLHLLDPHEPYDAPRLAVSRGWATANADRDFDAERSLAYDEEILYLDTEVGRFLEQMETRLDRRNTLLAIVADHGEHLGEDAQRGHAKDLTDTLLRVPLLVRWPDGRAGRLAAPMPLVGLRALLLDRILPGQGWPIRAHLIPPSEPREEWRAVRSETWKYVEVIRRGATRRALYRLPDERTDETAARPEVAAGLAGGLPALPKEPATRDPEDVARLRALGYLH
jgi:Sulfatase